jgi:hypothetical protein
LNALNCPTAHQGRCYLHFPRKPTDEEETVGNQLVEQLANLTLTVTERSDDAAGAGGDAGADGNLPKEIKLRCEFLPKKQQQNNSDTEQQVQKNRIETTDEKTAV